MELRQARPDEGPDIAAVWLRSRKASIPAIPPPKHSADEVETWFCETVLPNREVWVAEDEGAVIAVLVLDGEWVDQLYVDPGRTSQGIGTRLLDIAKQRRPTDLRLWTFQSNSRARRFYERHGFVARETSAGDNEEGAPDVCYIWPDQPLRGGPMTTAPPSTPYPLAGDGFPLVCSRCGEPLGDDPPRLYWHEAGLVFAYYHSGCPPVD
jgi:GNAT superfamily N-acetyltransferase